MSSICKSNDVLEMIEVPAGKLTPFWIAKDKNPETINKFSVMKYPVTQYQFEQFLAKKSEWSKDNAPLLFVDENYLKWQTDSFKNKKQSSKSLALGNKEKPVTFVSWFAANAFCEFYQMRLPTTIEWEYIASASETKSNAMDDSAFLNRILEWYGLPDDGNLGSVKTAFKNVYNIYGLHGLIWEWVDDFNTNFVTGESREDSSFNRDLFCGAGGLAGGNKENYAAFMRFAFRSSLKGKSTVWNLGFRCVK